MVGSRCSGCGQCADVEGIAVCLDHYRPERGGNGGCRRGYVCDRMLNLCMPTDVQLLGPGAGRKTAKLVRPLRLVQKSGPGAPAEVGGVNIHATVAVDGRDRQRLERLCRYIARPPLSLERLDEHPDGRVRIRFKSAWKDGTLRYHGVLAGHSRDRAEVVPQELAKDESSTSGDAQQLLFEPAPPLSPPPPPSRHPWAFLLRRVFAVDIITCPHCQGAMRVIAVATEADEIRAVHGTIPRARPPPPVRQLELDFAAA